MRKATSVSTTMDSDENNDSENQTVANLADQNLAWGSDGVYEDLELLERAIMLENSDLKLKQSKLKEQIDFIDQSKRLVVPDALRFVIIPLFYALGLSKLLTKNHGVLSAIASFFTKAMDAHFWIAVVAAPTALNTCKVLTRMRKKKRKKSSREPNLYTQLDPIVATMMLSQDVEETKASCDDTVSFLTEYWTSAVNGLLFLHTFKILLVTQTSILTPFSRSGLVKLWLSGAQLLTRLAAVVSLYQYPEKMYDLERSELLDRPTGLYPTVMLKLVRLMMVFAPLGMISDASRILSNLPRETIKPLYASIAVFMFGTWTRMRDAVSAADKEDPFAPVRLNPPKLLPKLFYGLSFLALWRNQLGKFSLRKEITLLELQQFMSTFPILFWKTIGVGALVSMSLLGPLIHLKAFSKIFIVEHKNDLPDLLTQESYNAVVRDRPDRAYDKAWRHSLRWRKPQRLEVSKGWVYHDIVYSFFVKGSVQERLENFRTQQIKNIVSRGRTIEERIDKELQDRKTKNEASASASASANSLLLNGDVGEWKTRAMELQAKKHEESYKRKSFEDPLGIAVYRAFGIGLGYNFDHTSELPAGKEPTPRRLQARAAKSAIRRYNELNDIEQALIERIKSTNENDELSEDRDRDKKILEETRKRNDEELKYLANKLVELIPTTSSADEFGLVDAAKFSMKETKYRKISQNEYRKLEDDPLELDDDNDVQSDLYRAQTQQEDSDSATKTTGTSISTSTSESLSQDNDDKNDRDGFADIQVV